MSTQRLGHLLAGACVVAATVVLTPGVSMAAAAPSGATCPSGGNPGLWNPAGASTPVPAAYQWGRKIELRYQASARCAWGRISNGSPGDSTWVDWSRDGGRTWTQLSVTKIASGYTQTYTTAWNDAGYVMRACGKAGIRPEIACTGWF